MTFSGKSWPSSISRSFAAGRFFSAYSRSVVRIWSSISASSRAMKPPACRSGRAAAFEGGEQQPSPLEAPTAPKRADYVSKPGARSLVPVIYARRAAPSGTR
jgi:hypothetical protein